MARITIDPEICFGKPCVRGMRWPVENVLELIASGMTFPEIVKDHPELEIADLQAVLEFARRSIAGEIVRVA